MLYYHLRVCVALGTCRIESMKAKYVGASSVRQNYQSIHLYLLCFRVWGRLPVLPVLSLVLDILLCDALARSSVFFVVSMVSLL